MPPGVREPQKGLTRRAAHFTSVAGFQMNLINIVAAVTGSAVLERYPNLRISLGESRIGWLPYGSTAWTSSGKTASGTSA